MPPSAEPLVGRSAELAALDESLATLARRRFAAIEIVGEPGIGKTRLLAELEARADRQGQLVLTGSASELEADLPFGVFVDALDEYLHGLEPRRLDGLDAQTRAELVHVFPSLPGGAPAPGERYRLHRAVRVLLEELARPKPIVLVLDDLHWADSGSLELLGALLRRPPDAGVLLALAVRPRQVPERLAAALERSHQAGGLQRIELGSLSAEEARLLVGDAADGVFAASGGNPFYLQQLARAPHHLGGGPAVPMAGVQVPRAVAAALAGELALLSSDARQLLAGASVAGDPFEPELAAAAAGVPEAAAMEALDDLFRRDLVRPTDVPRRFRFRHPLVRGAVYESTPGGWRLLSHERCARALAERGASALERAHHVERSARLGDPEAIAVLREAGAAAVVRAPASAARLYASALRLLGPDAPERPPLLGALAEAHAAAGQWREAHAAIVEALDRLPEDAVALRVQLTAGCAALELLLGRHPEASARLRAALGALSGEPGPETVGLLLALCRDAFFAMDYGAMRGWARRAVDTARALDDTRRLAAALSLLAMAGAFDGAIAEARVARAEAAALVDAMSDTELGPSIDLSVDSLAGAEILLDHPAEAEAHSERALAVAEATGQGQVLPVLFWAATVRTIRGRLPEAIELFDTAIEIARVAGQEQGLAWNLFGRSITASAVGDVTTALATAREASDVLRTLPRSFPTTGAGHALASALLADEDPAGALEVLLDAGGGEELPRFPGTWRSGSLDLLTRCQLALGRRADAARTAERIQALAAAHGLSATAAMADRAAAAVALDAGEPLQAARLALRAAAELVSPVEAALARVLAARALAAAGETDRAVAELERAANDFEAHGATGHREAAERDLRRLGRRTRYRRTGAAGIGSLTERELQIARLVVDRRTNAEIAAELYLSTKTVETHLRNLFHKLDVSSRVEVARAIERAESLKTT